MRQSSNRPEWCMATSSHCGCSLRFTPRNSGTSVCSASSWPGTMRLANTMAGSITGRPWIVPGRLDEALVVEERLDAVDQRPAAVGVLLAEVVGARRERGDRFAGARGIPPASQKLRTASWRWVRPLADFGVDLVLLPSTSRTRRSARTAAPCPRRRRPSNRGSKRTYSWRVTPTTLPGHMSSTRSRSRL